MKRLKHNLTALLAVLLLASAAAFSAFADGGQTCPSCGYAKNQAGWKFCFMCGTSLHKHTWKDATCETPRTCTDCGAAEGDPAGHSFSNADTGSGHQKSPATCTNKAVYYYSCSTCGKNGTATFTSGNTIKHSFTKKDTSIRYLKSYATCTSKAVYYYSCFTCGASSSGSDTFTSGDYAGHLFAKKDTSSRYLKSSATCTSKAVYYYSCSKCGACSSGTDTFTSGDYAGHRWQEATRTNPKTCSVCGKQEGTALGCYTNPSGEYPNAAFGNTSWVSFKLNTPIKNCTKFTVSLDFFNVEGTNPYGTWRVYYRNPWGGWFIAGEMDAYSNSNTGVINLKEPIELTEIFMGAPYNVKYGFSAQFSITEAYGD